MDLTPEQLDIIKACSKDEEGFQKILATIGGASKKIYEVLAVDDHEAICTIVQAAVEMERCKVACVNSGQAAIDAILAKKWDLVFLDIILPDIDGGEVFNRMRQSELNKETPVVFITGLIKPDEEQKLVPRNEKYLGKPFTLEKLRQTTREVLNIT